MREIAIIGAGPSAITAGIFALENLKNKITFFDEKPPLTTLLPTGGGRCNLAHAVFDNTELVKFYPRGEKFLLSVFSRFSTADTIDFFENIGVKTYIQDDLRVFPRSNSSKEVRDKLLTRLKGRNADFVRENVVKIVKNGDKYDVLTKNSTKTFDKVIVACGIKNNENLLLNSGIELVLPRPSLCALCVEDKELYTLSGVVLPCYAEVFSGGKKIYGAQGDFLITHKSLSGPAAYEISAYCTYFDFPWELKINAARKSFEELDAELVSLLNENSKKDILNIISGLAPRSFCGFLLQKCSVSPDTKAFSIDKNKRRNIAGLLTDYKTAVISYEKGGELVTAGGVRLDCINPKTMEYKNSPGLYFCGEVLDVDGLKGGFNLQNCWSTGYLAGKTLAEF